MDNQEKYLSEFNSNILPEFTEKKERIKNVVDDAGGTIDQRSAAIYYVIMRARKPDLVVETGVANGLSSWIVLEAINKNESGKLISIDLPRQAEDVQEFLKQKDISTTYNDPRQVVAPKLPEEKNEPGWIVPERLQDFWTLYLGRSQRVLPETVEEVQEMDIFIHDSEHTTSCMLFEYEFAWNWMAKDGLILSDDCNLSDAFSVFKKERAPQTYRITEKLGIAAKSEF